MIFRISTGTANSGDDSARYADFLESQVFPELRVMPGHLGAYLLRRDSTGGRQDVMIMTLWESVDAVRAFAGEDVEAAVFEPEAQRLLPERDERVRHYEVVLRSDAP